jgi:GPI transamidase subunit PIG-U
MPPRPIDPSPVPLEGSGGEDSPPFRPGLIVVVAVIAALLKVVIALTSLGTNDVLAFYQFAKAVDIHGLTWLYEHSILFNHPPLIGYFLGALAGLEHQPFWQQNGLTFPFFLRLPGIIADFAVLLLVLSVAQKYPHLRPPRWALFLFAASPVSIMVTGFHGNTDPLLVFFLLLASIMAVHGRPALCGVSLALACQVKIIPLLLLPIFFLVWVNWRRTSLFLGSFLVSSIIFCLEPLLKSPVTFAKNVLAYGSFWGVWGLTYCLRVTGPNEFNKTSFFNLSAAQNAIIMILKVTVVLGILVLAWRRRKLPATALFASIGYAWMIFFVFSPGVAAQYLVWLAPFILFLSPTFYGFLVAGSSVFLFAFYTITAGGFPWYFAHASNKLSLICAHWASIPWLTLLGGLIAFGLNARRQNPNFRFLSLTAIQPATTSE